MTTCTTGVPVHPAPVVHVFLIAIPRAEATVRLQQLPFGHIYARHISSLQSKGGAFCQALLTATYMSYLYILPAIL